MGTTMRKRETNHSQGVVCAMRKRRMASCNLGFSRPCLSQ
jgi:hypothetical protein